MCHFMEPENKNILLEGAKVFGIQLDESAMDAFDRYLKELLKWNQKINLTAIHTEQGIVQKHFLDSLAPFPHLPRSSSLLDIGSGAGFPGIPLKIVQPDFDVTLIDSVRKKIDFQKHIIRSLGLKGIEAVHGRVQDKEILQRFEGRFDIVISRAFSDLGALLDISLPFLKKGGAAVAMKGEKENDKIRFLNEEETSPYRLEKTVSLVLPFSTFKRTILLFKKR
jgi:16S rRNA (guanine527-N7)-methyltransferase